MDVTNSAALLAPNHESHSRDSIPSVVLAVLLGIALIVVLGLRAPALLAQSTPWRELIFWAVLILVINLVPVQNGDRSFTLDTPFLLAMALLYRPESAAIAAMVGGLDIREILGRVTVWRALFNRAQIAMCVFGASLVFHALAPAFRPLTRAVVGTGAALVVFHVANAMLVAAYTRLRSNIPFGQALNTLTIGPTGTFLATHLGYGVLALVLAYLFEDVGGWAVATFLIPLLVAREMLVRAEEARLLSAELRQRERILEQLFDRIAEERRDERQRIATGLHDDVLQSLIRMSQLGSFLVKEINNNPVAEKDAKELAAISGDVANVLRDVVNDLVRSPLGRGGLVPTLRTLAADLQLHWRVPIEILAAPGLRLPPDVQLVAYQVAREAITNSLKHAHPTAVVVEIQTSKADLLLSVRDNGSGFNPESVDASNRFGLGLMRERVRLLGGALEIESGATGSTIRATFPCQAAPKEARGGDLMASAP